MCFTIKGILLIGTIKSSHLNGKYQKLFEEACAHMSENYVHYGSHNFVNHSGYSSGAQFEGDLGEIL